ncbi:hypothetical protein NKJ46_31170 [Mesorhizobium sp. M0166]|uniref:hypothetical protein n=1 Tax=Mesorhizobium sp. M0166 TaxID=2956902 RepID=UPI00333A5F14
MDKGDGDNLPEWLPGDLPEDGVIRADIATRVSRETYGKNGPDHTVVMEAGLDHNLLGNRKKLTPPSPTNHPWFRCCWFSMCSRCWYWPGTRSLVRIFYSARSVCVFHDGRQEPRGITFRSL